MEGNKEMKVRCTRDGMEVKGTREIKRGGAGRGQGWKWRGLGEETGWDKGLGWEEGGAGGGDWEGNGEEQGIGIADKRQRGEDVRGKGRGREETKGRGREETKGRGVRGKGRGQG